MNEILLVDDGSTDGTAQQLGSVQGKHKVRVLSMKRNAGVAAARNAALAQATSDYVWFIDVDDDWVDNAVDDLAGVAASTAADIVVCQAKKVSALGRDGTLIDGITTSHHLDRRDAVAAMLKGEIQGYLWSKLLRRTLLGADPFPAMRSQSDFYGVFQTVSRADVVAVLPKVLYFHIARSGSITSAKNADLTGIAKCADLVRSSVREDPLLATQRDLAVFLAWFMVVPYVATPTRIGLGWRESQPYSAQAKAAARESPFWALFHFDRRLGVEVGVASVSPALLSLGYRIGRKVGGWKRTERTQPKEGTQKMAKIVFVIQSWHGGGAEYVARTWIDALTARGHEITVVTTGTSETHLELPDGLRIETIASKQGYLGKARELNRFISTSDAEVAVSLQSQPNLILVLSSLMKRRRDRIPAVISERNMIAIGLRASSVKHRLKMRAARLLYRHSDHVIAISHPVAAEMVSHFAVDPEQCTVIPNPATAKTTTTQSELAIGESGFSMGTRLVLPCRLVTQKRPLLIIDISHELKTRGVDCEVVVFGDGPLRNALISHARELDVKVDFAGWVEDWHEMLRPGDVVVLPSMKEGFGNVLVEAASVGVPSVACSQALGVADAIVPGITGALSDASTAEDFANAVMSAQKIGKIDASAWLARFSKEESADKLETLLLGIITNGERHIEGTLEVHAPNVPRELNP